MDTQAAYSAESEIRIVKAQWRALNPTPLSPGTTPEPLASPSVPLEEEAGLTASDIRPLTKGGLNFLASRKEIGIGNIRVTLDGTPPEVAEIDNINASLTKIAKKRLAPVFQRAAPEITFLINLGLFVLKRVTANDKPKPGKEPDKK